MKAVGKYIVIDPIKEVDTTTKGGLILAEKQREDIRYRRAKVVEPGSDVEVLKKGDEVYYDKSAGFNIEINKENYKVIKEFDDSYNIINMSFSKKFTSKSPIAYHGGPHGDVTANTKAFSKMSDILPKKNITPPQQSTYGIGTSTKS